MAAVEAMVALRDLAGDRLEVEVHAPRQGFVYRPLAVGEPFFPGGLIEFDLEDLAARAGATFCLDSVTGVDPDNHHVSTPDRDEVPYDYLLICPGAKMLAAVSGAETFWGVSEEGGVAETIGRLRAGDLHRLAFTIPASGWPLPIYELALLAEAELSRLGSRAGTILTIVTPEDLPLGVFGTQVGERVGELLSERGIELVTGSHAIKFSDGLLQITPGRPIETEAVISTPGIEGRQIGGLPKDPSGFIPVDEFSRVVGLDRVYAAGDVTAFPVKQGGIATQQADVAAEAIAAAVGVDLAPRPFDPVLRATLWTGEKPQYLYGKLSGGFGETSVFSDHALWEHEGKIAGRYLAPFLNGIPGEAGPGTRAGPQPRVAAG
ncbi:MAG: FAD-dependent oxidoreductase [Solirubrobacterales bacterium]|nr:FAD-dependent oxidoreductase [Solirubrobacterales bacterium]